MHSARTQERDSAILFSPVADPTMFKRAGFYVDDLRILGELFSPVQATNSLRRVLLDSYDIAFGYFYSYSVFAAIIARLRGKRVILTGGADNLHSEVKPSRLQQVLHRLLFRLGVVFAHRILAVSHADKVAMVSIARTVWCEDKIEFCPHAVDVDRYLAILKARRKKAVGAGVRALTLCWMGSESNVHRKGILRGIDVIAELARQGVDVHLSVVGTLGPGTLLVSNHIANLGVEKLVTVVGPVSEGEKSVLLSDADLYLQLSTYEGFGVAALEAVLAGVFVCHSGAGGLLDSVDDLGHLFNIGARQLQEEVAKLKAALERFQSVGPNEGRLIEHAARFTHGRRAQAIQRATR